jgi:PAS domain S-box-containing protein
MPLASGTALVITVRRNASDGSREQYRLVAEGTNAVPFTYDPVEQRFVYVGPRAKKLFGYAPEGCTEAGFLEQLIPGDEICTVRGRLDSARVGDDFELECPALTADGRKLCAGR